MSGAATANSTSKRGEETGRLDQMSAGSMSLPEFASGATNSATKIGPAHVLGALLLL